VRTARYPAVTKVMVLKYLLSATSCQLSSTADLAGSPEDGEASGFLVATLLGMTTRGKFELKG
jgi:hypothetical protein